MTQFEREFALILREREIMTDSWLAHESSDKPVFLGRKGKLLLIYSALIVIFVWSLWAIPQGLL